MKLVNIWKRRRSNGGYGIEVHFENLDEAIAYLGHLEVYTTEPLRESAEKAILEVI